MNIYEKLAAVQQEVRAPKNQKNTHLKYNYRSAEGILEAAKPILAKYKASIMLSDDIVEKNGRTYVEACAIFIDTEATEGKYVWWTQDEEGEEVEHSEPEWSIHKPLIVKAYAREADSKPGLDVAQVTGSASSYARKYALNGLLLLDDAKQDPDTEDNTRRTALAEEMQEQAEEKREQTLKQYASEEQLRTIRELAKQANVDLDAIGEDLGTMSAKRADAMIARLRDRIGG